jgi:hypothetical protein
MVALSGPDSKPAAVVAIACGIVALFPELESISKVVAVVVPMLRSVLPAPLASSPLTPRATNTSTLSALFSVTVTSNDLALMIKF